MKIISKTIIGLFVTASLVSCQDYLDVNDSPNNPTAESITPDLLLGGAISTPYANTLAANQLGNVMMNNWGSNVNAFTGGFDDEFRLNLTTTFYTTVWDNTYRGIATLRRISSSEEEVYDNHKAIATIVQSYYFQNLVDHYGDLPFENALQFGENYTPSYDDDMAIYRSLVEDLDNAIAMINDADDSDAAVGSEDVIFQGNMSKWVQFANTLKLRLLARQFTLAETDGATASYLAEEFADLELNFVNEDVTINPGYVNGAGKQNPYYATYGFDTEGNAVQNRNAIVAADYAVEFMQGQQPNNPNVTENIATGVFDSRVNAYYELIDNTEVVGVVQGANSDTSAEELSKFGTGLIIDSSQDGYLMLQAEVLLLQAEAISRSYIPGDAKTKFQDAIRASYESLGLSSSSAESYITDSDSENLIGWDGSPNKIEAIMTQKWLATNGRTAQESWIEYRRTGFPNVPLAITAEKAEKPNRLLYPTSEYNTNAANVPQQSQSDAFDTAIFWDVN
jgi:hypothetical protein